MSFKGNVESFSLADLFQSLAAHQRTGTLRVAATDSTEEKFVFFQDGRVRYLAKNTHATLLPPEMLLARGQINKIQYEAAMARQAERHDSSITTCLLEIGALNDAEYRDAVARQIEEEIYDLFGWVKAAFDFNEGPPSDEHFADQAADVGWTIDVPVTNLIMEAARRVDEWDRLRQYVPSYREIFVVVLSMRKAIERGEIHASPLQRGILSLVDGMHDVEDIIADAGLFRFEVVEELAEFVQQGSIRPANVKELNFAEQECSRLELPECRAKVLERILALGGEDLAVRKTLAELCVSQRQLDKACIHFTVLAEEELKAAHADVAIELFKRVQTLVPTNLRSREKLAALYASRGQKREAFVHYRELFNAMMARNQPAEAAQIARLALDCDPNDIDLRRALIDLLLKDGPNGEAATHLEILGDAAERNRNAGMASEAYRRAMQMRGGTRQLRKKLDGVLLTKKERAARRHRVMVALFGVLLIAGTVFVLWSKERVNGEHYVEALAKSESLARDARQLEAAEQYDDAAERYGRAAHLFDAACGPLIRRSRATMTWLKNNSCCSATSRLNASNSARQGISAPRRTIQA